MAAAAPLGSVQPKKVEKKPIKFSNLLRKTCSLSLNFEKADTADLQLVED